MSITPLTDCSDQWQSLYPVNMVSSLKTPKRIFCKSFHRKKWGALWTHFSLLFLRRHIQSGVISAPPRAGWKWAGLRWKHSDVAQLNAPIVIRQCLNQNLMAVKQLSVYVSGLLEVRFLFLFSFFFTTPTELQIKKKTLKGTVHSSANILHKPPLDCGAVYLFIVFWCELVRFEDAGWRDYII